MLRPMALAIAMRCRQYSTGMRTWCISPLRIWNGLPSNRNALPSGANENRWRRSAVACAGALSAIAASGLSALTARNDVDPWFAPLPCVRPAEDYSVRSRGVYAA